MKITIMGAGGIGSYIAGRMVQAGQGVTFVTRGSHLQALLERGLEVKNNFGELKLEIVNAVSFTTFTHILPSRQRT